MVLAANSAAFTAMAAPATLPSANQAECFKAALRRSEIIADRTELIVQAEERYKQAVGVMLPNVNANASAFTQASPGEGQTGRTVAPAYEPLVKLSATQPLFRGLRNLAALRQTKDTVAAQTENKRQAKAQLYNDVAQNFYTILSIERDLANLNTEISLYEKRTMELKDRVKIGRSRVSEVLTTESAMASLRSQVKQLQGQLDAAREAFVFLTGLNRDTRLVNGAPAVVTAESIRLEPLESYLSIKYERPDIKAAEYQRSAASEGVSIAKGGHLPSADFSANYYFVRRGVDQNVDWDVIASLTFPIFAGGVIQSRVREAASVERETELALSRVKRQADTEIRSFYRTIEAESAQLRTLADAKRLSERNYKEQLQEYRLGLVTNLDVLQALTSFQESNRALDRAYFAAKIDQTRLETAAAKSPYNVE